MKTVLFLAGLLLFVQGAPTKLAPAPASKTFVYSVEQASTTQSQTWTHRVAEAGDYQLGMAWVEVLSGEEVTVTIRVGKRVLRTLKARPGLAPTRLETRLEGLAAGAEVSVTATPKNARYRLGFQLALCTPTFPGAKVFRVSDFGAVGDGVTDDFAAIHRAVAAARQADSAILRFDGSKTYRAIGLRDFTEEALFALKGAKNLKIEGGGARVLLHPPDSFVQLDEAENVQLDGFQIDYDPKPYYQGTIRKVDVEAMTIDLEVPERYPVPEVGKNEFRAAFFGRSFFPDSPGARVGRGDNLYIEEVTHLDSERRVRLHIRPSALNSATPDAVMKPRMRRAAEQGATEFVVPHVKYAHRGRVNLITRSARVLFSNLRYESSPHFWSLITHNTGPITLRNVDLKMARPETELFVSWRDGLHIKNSRWGVLIEDGDWDGAATYDDSFAIYSRAQKLVGVAGATLTLTPTFESKEPFLWRKGDWASVWSPDQQTLRGMARVLEVDATAADQTFRVTLESLPTAAAPGDIVLHEESLNRGSVIRRCSTSSTGTDSSSTRFRCADVTFENNHFEDFRFWFHAGSNGPRPRNIVLKNNWISNLETGELLFQQGLDCVLQGNQLVGVTLRFDSDCTNMRDENNRSIKRKRHEVSSLHSRCLSADSPGSVARKRTAKADYQAQCALHCRR